MSKVLATLDFDGVVSPIDSSRDFEAESSFEVFRLGAFPCAISQSVLDFLGELQYLTESEPERFATVWASSWESITENFFEDSAEAIPHFPYLSVARNKAQAIADATIAENASLVLVFEDHSGVHQNLRNIWKKDESFADRKLVSFRPKLQEGLQLSDILSARSLIAAELGKA